MKDLTGQKFTRLLVISKNLEKINYVKTTKNRTVIYWNCLCDCGKTHIATTSNLTNGGIKSCGCLKIENSKMQKNTKSIRWEKSKELENVIIGITNKNEQFMIDDEDYKKVEKYCWRIDKYNQYVIANARNGTNKTLFLHKLILDKENYLVDHINHNKSDNRKCNLRYATKSQNNINIKKKINNKSGYTGVKMNKFGKFIAQIDIDNKRKYLGTFEHIEDAIKARRNAEIKYHGEWDGEIYRQDFTGIIKEEATQPDLEEAEDAREETI